MIKFKKIFALFILLSISAHAKRILSKRSISEDETIENRENVDPEDSTESLISSEVESGTSISQENDVCIGLGCLCSSSTYCSWFYSELRKKKPFCDITEDEYEAQCGISAKAPFDAASKTRSLYSHGFEAKELPPEPEIGMAQISAAEIDKGVELAIEAVIKQSELEKTLQEEGIAITDVDTPEFIHMSFFLTSPEALELAKTAFIQEQAAVSLKEEKFHLTSEQVRSGLSKVSISTRASCPAVSVCNANDTIYRRIDGSCNNLRHPDWGKALTAYERMRDANYFKDSIPRKAKSGSELPSARLVSSEITTDLDMPSQNFSLALMQFGQYLDHDLTQAPISRFGNSSGIQCCTSNGLPLSPELLHPECFPISIPQNDKFYSKFGRRCMNFVRSLPAPASDCETLGPRNQMNSRTHFLDASVLYGSSDSELVKIREFSGGLLKMGPGNMLPDNPTTSGFDFLAGDGRVNTHPHLGVIHTVWVRQHNRVAKLLSRMNTWDDEKLFQETRKIVAAQYQHIVYNEWLPIILGRATMKKLGLSPLTSGFIDTYTNNLNPNIRNEFSAAAFRFGHSIVEGHLELYSPQNRQIDDLDFGNVFNQPSLLTETETSYGKFLRGLYMQPMQDCDFWVEHALSTLLFKSKAQSFGLDLPALNIQRGRDHGIPTYPQLRFHCKLSEIKTFQDLKDVLDSRVWQVFQTVYQSVDDIDAFPAGISEIPFNGGIVGETFNCIISHQFFRLKFGDSFFYENGDLNSSFTIDQLNQIRKTTFSRIICDNNAPDVRTIQPNVFRLPDNSSNPKVPCSSTLIPKVDLNPWKAVP